MLITQIGKCAYVNIDITIKLNYEFDYSYTETAILECSVPDTVLNGLN